MKDPKELQAIVDNLMASSLVQESQIEVLLSLCQIMATRSGLTEIKGLSILDWFQREKQSRVDAILLELEDKDPAVAAFLQSVVDNSRRRLERGSHSNE
jgi:hypothetical protein